MRLVKCAICPRVFRTNVHNRKYCSAVCRSKRSNVRRQVPTAAERAHWARKRASGSTTERGYGREHQALRERWRPSVERGEVDCWRCGRRIAPRARWDLGHNDRDRSRYEGPEHRRCNRGAAARAGNRQRGHAGKVTTTTSRAW